MITKGGHKVSFSILTIMIVFDRLEISPDGKHLTIDARVDDMKYYDNVGICSVVIDTQDTYIPGGPSQKHVFEKIVSD